LGAVWSRGDENKGDIRVKARLFIAVVRNAVHRCHLCLATATSRRALFREAQRVRPGNQAIQVMPFFGSFDLSLLLAFLASSPAFAQSSLPSTAVRTRNVLGPIAADFSASEEQVAVFTNQVERKANSLPKSKFGIYPTSASMGIVKFRRPSEFLSPDLRPGHGASSWQDHWE
jgi:hypothetical protein